MENKQNQKHKVTNINEAVSILRQAAELGRQRGIFEWGDLDLIKQSMDLLDEAAENAQKNQSTPKVDNETNEVVLEPTKQQ